MINGEGNPSQLSNNDTAVSPMFGYGKDQFYITMGTIKEQDHDNLLFGLYSYY